MTRAAAFASVLLACMLGGSGCAAGPALPPPHGSSDAVAGGDALAASLAAYVRLVSSPTGPSDVAGFLTAHPDWPDRETLVVRYDQALKNDPDDAAVASACAALTPTSADALERCADASGASGLARAAWRDGYGSLPRDDARDTAFLARWGGAITADDQWARFERLTPPRGNAREAAARTADALAGVRAAIAQARLAMSKAGDPLAVFGSVPAAGQDDPALVLATARQLRRGGDLARAVAFWRGRAMGVEAATPASMQASFWNERDALARALPAGAGTDAFAIADDAGNAAAAARGEALFLAGWLALRRLGQPDVAMARFRLLGALSSSVTTQARAAYWLARAEQARGQAAASLRDDALAASFPTTFYGQLALASLAPGEDAAAALGQLRAALARSAAPSWTSAQAVAFASGAWARAAVLLVAWGEARHAKPFLWAADAQATDLVGHALAAELASTLGLPDEAVAIARRAGRAGHALPPIGWPRPFAVPPALPAPLVLGLIRQESGFDAEAVSPSGALGLMQLLPGTAAEIGRRDHLAVTRATLTADPSLNVRLGTAYLRQLVDRFGGNVPLALAGYNAGPHRVSGWPPPPPPPPGAAFLDRPDAATVDWIEGIPVAETRNYVQRVLENQAVYAALGPAQGAG